MKATDNKVLVYGLKLGLREIGHLYTRANLHYLKTNAISRKIITELYPDLKGCKTLLLDISDVKWGKSSPEIVNEYIDINLINKKIEEYNRK